MYLIAEGEQVSDSIDLQDRLDTAGTRLKIPKDVIREPLYDVHVWICGRHALLQMRQKVSACYYQGIGHRSG